MCEPGLRMVKSVSDPGVASQAAGGPELEVRKRADDGMTTFLSCCDICGAWSPMIMLLRLMPREAGASGPGLEPGLERACQEKSK